jgi:NTE family protein
MAAASRVAEAAASTTLREWLAAEPYTLAMSSGFFGFFAHGGMLSVLEDEGLLPAAVTGSSAGALTGGLWAAGLDTAHIARLYLGLRKVDFWDPAPGAGLLKGERFRALLREASPVRDLADCRRPLALSAFDLRGLRTRVLADGGWVESVYASCAVPLMFHPIRIGSGWYVDGGLADRPGLRSVAAGARVFHHHLAARSPWRRRGSPVLEPPQRDNMATLVINDLPRPTPDALHRAGAAWQAARAATRKALGLPLSAGVVAVTAPAEAAAEPA